MNIKLSKGADVKLKGVADRVYSNTIPPTFYAVKPTDFHLLTPKMLVKVGDIVAAGDVIFCDKNSIEVKFSSP